MNTFARLRIAVAYVLALTLAVAPAAGAADGCSMLGVPASATAKESGRPIACVPEGTDDADDAELAEAAEAAEEAAHALVVAVADLLAQGAPPAPAAPATPRAVTAPKPAPAPRAARATRHTASGRGSTDTTVVVRRGTRLELHNFGGAIAIATWAKDAVRVQADHSRRDWIDVRSHDGVLRVQSASRMGPAQAVEFKLTLPAWMPIQLSGIYNDVTADGVKGGINVETVRGDIEVRRAAGLIELRSVEGLVDLSDAKGTISVSSVNDAVRLMNVSGTIQAEAVNGDIQLIDLTSRSVEATTVNGAVLFDGKMFDGGTYRFATHNGDIAMGMTDRSNATVTVSTYAGDFDAPFPIRLLRKDKGKRFEFVLGTGKAAVELESFQGAIQLYSPGDKEMLQRFKEAWRGSEKDEKKYKWIEKGETTRDWNYEYHVDDHDDDDDEETPPPPPRKKGK